MTLDPERVIPADQLAKVGEHAALLVEFDLGYSSAANGSITATLKFPGGVFDQEAHLHRTLACAGIVGTLHENLTEARRLIAVAVEEGMLPLGMHEECRSFLEPGSTAPE